MFASSSLHPFRTLSVRFQLAMIVPSCTTAASYTTSSRPVKLPRTKYSLSTSVSKSPIVISAVRYSSTASATSTNPTPNSPQSASNQLTWNRFLELRRTRRRISVLASSVTALATVMSGLRISIERNWDSMAAATVGLDPIVVTGLGAIGFLATGWLIGPFFGNSLFNVWYRNIRSEFEAKEREFYNRVKRHRVDPTSSSMANPVPDYYGEKIGSVADYRRWLKDQRAFNLKRGAYVGNK